MYNLAYKYNRFLISIWVFAPFVAYFTLTFLKMDYLRIMQLMSYIGVILLFIFKSRGKVIKIPNYLIFYLLFILYDFFSTFYLLDREFKIKYLFSNRLIGGFNLLLIIEYLPIKQEFYKNLIKWSKYILIFAVLIIILQQVIDRSFFVNSSILTREKMLADVSEMRLHSIYSWINPLSNGFAFVPIFILVVGDLIKNKKKFIFLIIAGLIYAILTKARWIMLNTTLVLLLLIVNKRNKIIQILKMSILIPMMVLSSFFILNSMGVDINKIVVNRILEENKSKGLENKSAGTRILAFKAFKTLFWENPIFGVGNIKYGMGGTDRQDYKLRSFLKGRSSQLHVGFLSLLYMYGIVGALFFNMFLYLLLKKLYLNAVTTRVWAPFLGILGFAIANLTLVNFSIFQMGFIIAMVADKYYSQSIGIKS